MKTNYNNTHKQVIIGISDDFLWKSYIVKRLQTQRVAGYSTYAETTAKIRALLYETNRIVLPPIRILAASEHCCYLTDRFLC